MYKDFSSFAQLLSFVTYFQAELQTQRYQSRLLVVGHTHARNSVTRRVQSQDNKNEICTCQHIIHSRMAVNLRFEGDEEGGERESGTKRTRTCTHVVWLLLVHCARACTYRLGLCRLP